MEDVDIARCLLRQWCLVGRDRAHRAKKPIECSHKGLKFARLQVQTEEEQEKALADRLADTWARASSSVPGPETRSLSLADGASDGHV